MAVRTYQIWLTTITGAYLAAIADLPGYLLGPVIGASLVGAAIGAALACWFTRRYKEESDAPGR